MSKSQNQPASAGRMTRIVRRLLVMLEGTDYKERFLRLAVQHAQTDIIGLRGWFRPAKRGRWGRHAPRGKAVDCIVTGGIMRANGGDYLIIDYTTEDGDRINGAEIPRSAFRQSPPNANVEASPPLTPKDSDHE